MIRALDLFSGIGGFSLAVDWLGGETVAFVEWEAWNRRVLAKHWPEAQFFGDIKAVTAEQLHGLGPIDLITGGYPCQPFSVAGQRRGKDDPRHLWPEMRRVIDTVRPRVVLAENVSGHVSMGLDTVLAEMESDGYTAGAVVVPAAGVNALHKRDRVWIIATRQPLADAEGIAQQLPGHEAQPGDAERDARVEHRRSGGRLDSIGSGEAMADTYDAGQREQRRAESVEAEHATAEYSGGDGTGAEASRAVDASTHELSGRLVRRFAARPTSGEISHADATQAGPDQDVRNVRDGYGAQEVQRETGGSEPVSGSSILLPGMLGDSAADGDGRGSQQPGKEVSQGSVRGMWHDGNASGASHQRGSHGQPPIEPDDLVSLLSHEMALEAWEEAVQGAIGLSYLRDACRWAGLLPEAPTSLQEVWRSLTHEEKVRVAVRACTRRKWDNPDLIRAMWADGSWEHDLPRVVTEEAERKQKLMAAGNAIVPVVAYEILRVIFGDAPQEASGGP